MTANARKIWSALIAGVAVVFCFLAIDLATSPDGQAPHPVKTPASAVRTLTRH